MTVFYDDFNRANGSLDNGWDDAAGAILISGGYLVGKSLYWNTWYTGLSDNGAHICEAAIAYATANSLFAGPIVKHTGTNWTGYSAHLTYSAPNYVFGLYLGSGSSHTLLTSANVGTSVPYSYTIRLEYADGHLTATYNGVTVLEADDVVYAGGLYGGIRGNTADTRVNWARITMGAAATLTVTPDVVGNYGGAHTDMSLLGGNTVWETSNPTFTVDAGSLANIVIVDDTHATAEYSPGDFLGTVTFADPSTGATDTVLVTSDPDLVPVEGGECKLTDAGADLVNRSGALRNDDHILTDETVVYSPGGGAGDLLAVDAIRDLWLSEFVYDANPPPGPSLFSLIWQILNGSNNPPSGPFTAPTGIPVAHHLDGITADLSNLTGAGTWTLALLLGELAGPLGTNLSDLEADLGVHGQMAYSSIVDAINVTRGPEMPTLTAILSAIEAIEPGGTTDLTPVLNLLNFLTGDGAVNLNSILSTLATMRGDNASTLHAIQAYCVTAIAKLDEIKTYLQDQLGPMAVTLAAIEAKVDAILALLRQVAATRFQPPVWPGLDNVDLYARYSLAGHIYLPGPMHGVRVEITSTDPGTGFYDYDVHRCWRNIGALAFVTEDGYAEQFQPLGFTNAIYVPKTMTRAGSVILHLGRGPEGWIQPWEFKAG